MKTDEKPARNINSIAEREDHERLRHVSGVSPQAVVWFRPGFRGSEKLQQTRASGCAVLNPRL